MQGKTPRPVDGWSASVSDDDAFVFGCDCFDAACYFEAHELWERPWMRAKNVHDDDDEALLHGLIKLAAAGVKVLAGEPRGVASHINGAAGHFDRVVVWGRGFSRRIVDDLADALLRGVKPSLP